MHQYGIDINTLDKFMGKPVFEKNDWGLYSILLKTEEFRLERVDIFLDRTFILKTDDKNEAVLFVGEGQILAGSVEVAAKGVVVLPPGSEMQLVAKKDTAVVYVFSGAADPSSVYPKNGSTFDFREKYWGSIETIVSRRYAGKKLVVRKGECSSLEFHCRKVEGYFIHSGKLLLRLRAGRGEDRFFELPAGTTFFIPPGLMHQRGGLEDTIIIEISTKDEDSDSFLVEDGAKQKMPKLV